MNALLLLNHRAGSLNGERDAVAAEELCAVARAGGANLSLRTAPPAQLDAALRAAVTERPEALFVGGGDGTISAAAAHLAGTDVALGVLPLGTMNHFAHDLGLPLDWRAAMRALVGARARQLDVGEVNGRVFVNNCSIGSYADAVRKRDALRRERGAGKRWAMLLATVKVFRELRRLRLRLEIDGEARALRTPFVVVANNRYSAHVLDYSLRPRLDEGKLWIYTTRAGRRLALLRLMWQSLLRTIDAVDGLDQSGVTAATVTPERAPLPVAVDGELVDLEMPLRFRSRPGALRVLVPAATPPRP
jgi:diacylglycerol kinase family enzyme